jgi:RNA polymerase sigma factor (sigma-70 family)
MHNKDKFEQLFLLSYEPMLRLALLLLKDDEEAKDVVSEVFTEMWDGTIDIGMDNPKGYLLMCVRNRCLDILNHMKIKERVCRLLTLDSQPAMTPPTDNEHEFQRIREIIDTMLTPRDRQILLMKYERKMKYREIAAELQISDAAVYKHLAQALNTLRTNLKQ